MSVLQDKVAICVAVFLAGPDASFVTGCTVTADGGGAFVG
jgi:NAD(P)-dependent dehydrogenase (short-subunit alcohol dehydrogenase family)